MISAIKSKLKDGPEQQLECKQPDICVGISQLETYLSLEPHVQLGIWANNPDLSAETAFVFKTPKGLMPPKRSTVKDIPSIGDSLSPLAQKRQFKDLVIPTEDVLYSLFSNLLDEVVARDSKVTRREDQLDQLCNILLLKLDSDKNAKIDPESDISFRQHSTASKTAEQIKKLFLTFTCVYPDIFISESDKELRFDDSTVDGVVKNVDFKMSGI